MSHRHFGEQQEPTPTREAMNVLALLSLGAPVIVLILVMAAALHFWRMFA